MAFGACRDREAAHDIVQESFLRVWRHLDEFDGRASFGTWIYRIVANLAIDHHRRNRRSGIAVAIDDCEESQLPCADDADPCAVAQEREYEARVSEAIGMLTPAHRNVLIARGEGKPYVQIAQEQGIPVGTVMSRVFHARRAYAEVMRAEEIANSDERTSTQRAYEGAEENENIMAKTYFGDIAQGRLPSSEKVDPFKVIVVGLDAPATPATEELVDEGANRELAELIANPDKFLASYEPETRRTYNLNGLTSLLTDGQLQDAIVAAIGDVFAVVEGRHRAVWMRLLHECLRGDRDIAALRGIIATVRAENGSDWMPAFKAKSPGTKDAQEMGRMVTITNTLRKVVTDQESYEFAMKRVRAAEKNSAKPDFDKIARDLNLSSGNVVRAYHRLSTMNADVIESVFSGAISINAVLQVARNGASPDEVSRIVAEMIAAGATSVRDAIATRRAAAGYESDSTVDDRDDDGNGGTRPRGDTERVERESPDAVTGSGTPRKIVRFAEKPLGEKFVDEYVDSLNGKANQHETLAIACLKLASKGWASLNKREKDAVEGVSSLYKSINAARKVAEAKAKKAAEARAKVNAPADPNAEALIADSE
jgi:RNA polymerase sigma-70 factor (ECF subfamily)